MNYSTNKIIVWWNGTVANKGMQTLKQNLHISFFQLIYLPARLRILYYRKSYSLNALLRIFIFITTMSIYYPLHWKYNIGFSGTKYDKN